MNGLELLIGGRDRCLSDGESCIIHRSSAKLLGTECDAMACTQGKVIKCVPECILYCVIPEECVINTVDLPRDVIDDFIKSANVSTTNCNVALVTIPSI